MLPHALAYNAAGSPAAMARIARALDSEDAAQAAFALPGRIGAKRALRDIGMPAGGVERAAELACQSPYPNRVPIDRDRIRALIARAWSGEPPA